MNLPTKHRLDDKNIIITGGTSGVGQMLVRNLSIRHGANIIVPARDLSKCQQMQQEVAEFYAKNKDKHPDLTDPAGKISCQECDLADFKSVVNFVKNLPADQKVDILVNNAAVLKPKPNKSYKRQIGEANNKDKFLKYHHSETQDGLEETWQVNAVAPVLMSMSLKNSNKFSETTKPKIINVTCNAHKAGVLDLTDLSRTNTVDRQKAEYDTYRGVEMYKQSKLANVLFTKEASQNWLNFEITCIEPGVATDTNLGRHTKNSNKAAQYLNPLQWILTMLHGKQSSKLANNVTQLVLGFETDKDPKSKTEPVKIQTGSLYKESELALNLLEIDDILKQQNIEISKEFLEQHNQEINPEELLKERENRYRSLNLGIYGPVYSKSFMRYCEKLFESRDLI